MGTKLNSERGKLTRRDFNRLALSTVGAAVAASASALEASAAHHEEEVAAPKTVTEVDSNALLLSQVQYVPVSEKPDQRCANCALLIAREGDYGKCGLFMEGQVPVTAWCTSWVQRRTG